LDLRHFQGERPRPPSVPEIETDEHQDHNHDEPSRSRLDGRSRGTAELSFDGGP
jgi:hypothetical protein